MLRAIFFEIGKMRVQKVGIKSNIGFRFGGVQPLFLNVVGRDADNAARFRRNGPVISVIANSADDLGPGNVFERLLQVGDEPVLGCYWAGTAGGLVLS